MGSRAGAARAGAAAALTMSRGAKPRGDRMAKARVASIETRTARADARMVGSEARGTQSAGPARGISGACVASGAGRGAKLPT